MTSRKKLWRNSSTANPPQINHQSLLQRTTQTYFLNIPKNVLNFEESSGVVSARAPAPSAPVPAAGAVGFTESIEEEGAGDGSADVADDEAAAIGAAQLCFAA